MTSRNGGSSAELPSGGYESETVNPLIHPCPPEPLARATSPALRAGEVISR